MRILELIGIDDSDELTLLCGHCRGGGPAFHLAGNMPILRHLTPDGPEVSTLVVGGRNSADLRLARPDLIYNAVCDSDGNRKSLAAVRKIVEAFGTVPVVNDPDRVLKSSRAGLRKELEGIGGLRLPRVFRFAPGSPEEVADRMREEELDFPAIFRPAGGEGGLGVLRLDSRRDQGALDRYAFDGREYYLIEYVEYASQDGLYRKYRYFVIGGRVVPGHLIVSDSWEVHADAEGKPASREREEKEFLKAWRRRQVTPIFRAIARAIGLDFFGIDCAFDREGKIVIFEINACMDPFSPEKENRYYTERYRRKMREAIGEMIAAKAAGRGIGGA